VAKAHMLANAILHCFVLEIPNRLSEHFWSVLDFCSNTLLLFGPPHFTLDIDFIEKV